MSDPFVGEIRMFAGNFAPQGWALCDGQLLAISQNDVLFSLVGTTYGGDGQNTFGLPDLRGRIPLHMGQGPGLSSRTIGQNGGSETVTLTPAQLPAHGHVLNADSGAANSTDPLGRLPAASTGSSTYGNLAPSVAMRADAVASAGGNQAHDNMMPFLCINFIIALFGIYPSRN